MSATQTAVNAKTIGFAGQLVNVAPNNIWSYFNEGSTEVPFGTLVRQGTSDNEALLIGSQANVATPVGIVLHSNAYAKDNELGDTGLKQKVMMNVMREGCVRVATTEAVVAGGAVRVRADTNEGAAGSATLGPGTFRTTSNTTHTVQITKGARWMSSTVNGFADLWIDLDAWAVSNDS